jgi:hypothetical protein
MTDYYRTHGDLSDPGRFRKDLSRVPPDLPTMCAFVQGIVIHADWAAAYGVKDTTLSRQTLPIAERLALVGPSGWDGLPASRRTPGTCRDFALMLCSLLRERGTAARVRCGFATYFLDSPFEDHWVCEYWVDSEERWALADAQLDPTIRAHLLIPFDPGDLPVGSFLNAGEAWMAWREGKADAEEFGHGAAKGAWFMRVNLMRDLLALNKGETSDWDGWRMLSAEEKVLDAGTLAACDRIATTTRWVGFAPPPVKG